MHEIKRVSSTKRWSPTIRWSETSLLLRLLRLLLGRVGHKVEAAAAVVGGVGIVVGGKESLCLRIPARVQWGYLAIYKRILPARELASGPTRLQNSRASSRFLARAKDISKLALGCLSVVSCLLGRCRHIRGPVHDLVQSVALIVLAESLAQVVRFVRTWCRGETKNLFKIGTDSFRRGSRLDLWSLECERLKLCPDFVYTGQTEISFRQGLAPAFTCGSCELFFWDPKVRKVDVRLIVPV